MSEEPELIKKDCITLREKEMILQAQENVIMLLDDIEKSIQDKIRQGLEEDELTQDICNNPQDYSEFT